MVFFAFGAVCSLPSPNYNLELQYNVCVWRLPEIEKQTVQTHFYYSCPVFVLLYPACQFVCTPRPLVLLNWVVVVQLSAEINGGLVFLGCFQLLRCSTPVFLLTFCVCTVCVCRGGCAHLATVHVSERLDLKGKDEVCRLEYYMLVWL